MRFTRQGRSELRRAWWWSALNGLGWSALYMREAALRREGPRPSEQPAARAAAGRAGRLPGGCGAAKRAPHHMSRRRTLPQASHSPGGIPRGIPEVSRRYPGGRPEAGRGMPLK